MKSLNEEPNRVENIDILKSFCAFLIVCIHVPFPGIVGAFITTLARIAALIVIYIFTLCFLVVIKRLRGKLNIS